MSSPTEQGTRQLWLFDCVNGICGLSTVSAPCGCVKERRRGRITYESRVAVPVVPAVVDAVTVEEAAWDLAHMEGKQWQSLSGDDRDWYIERATAVLRAAGLTVEGEQSEPRPGDLRRQAQRASEQVAKWPAWMRKAAGSDE